MSILRDYFYDKVVRMYVTNIEICKPNCYVEHMRWKNLVFDYLQDELE